MDLSLIFAFFQNRNQILQKKKQKTKKLQQKKTTKLFNSLKKV